MDMINQILPFYNSLEKQEKYRYDSNEVRYCPVHQLLSFLIKRTHSASNQKITSAYLVDTCETETDLMTYLAGTRINITAWTNYTGSIGPTFTDTAGSLLVVDSSGPGTALSNTFSVVSGKVYRVRIWLTYTSGDYPGISIADPTLRSNKVTLAAGWNDIYLTATGTGTYSLMLDNTNAASYKVGVPEVRIHGENIVFDAFTSVDYFQHDIANLMQLLTEGKYYLKISDSVNTYYSEWFQAVDMYPNLIESWQNSGSFPFEDFESSDTIIEVANTSGSGRAYSSTIACKNGDVITVIFDLFHKSGALPEVKGYENPGAAVIATGETAKPGRNAIVLTTTKATNLLIGFNVAANSSFETGEVLVIRNMDEFCKLTFTNSLDLSDILYQNSFIQAVFLKGRLLKIDPLQVITAQERAGVQIIESAITLPQFKIVDFVPPQLMQVLKLLPGHSTITVTDETGTTFSPDNIEVVAEEIDAEVFKVEIKFTDNEVINTANQSNIT